MGAVLGVVELVFLCVAGAVRLIPAMRPTCDRIAERLLALERARLATWLGIGRLRPAAGTAFSSCAPPWDWCRVRHGRRTVL
ncbi:hypothetical protein FHU36_004065 [Nonomuraea muscovyensis]|uniref:Uncharacterized protein n=1 Tax=Nonomuraea muscovyensis TaxID=1124761 RepID=A0A7X0C4X3_9ACTN|nr:hypothetical protein [Nonomuraea muscovyensis]MBB6347520.1 hypothetical protein [Nonomuraea muscovyensis]